MTNAPVFCFYCNERIPREYVEKDHFPVPKRHGGKDTVPTCGSCHTLKDRVALKNWPVPLMVEAVEQCGPLGRVFLAKAFAIKQDQDAIADEANPA